MTHLPARTGWEWLMQGIGLFRKQPSALTTLLLANTLASLFLSNVPVLGPILTVVLVPSFSMAFMQACLLIENGERVTPAVLLTGFRQPVVASLCKIGLIYLAVWVVLILLLNLSLSGIAPDLLRQIAQADPNHPPQVPLPPLLGIVAVLLLNLATLIALCFAAPLACWKRMGAGKATFYSFFAVVRSARVFIVLLAAWLGLLFGISVIAAALLRDTRLGQVVLLWLFFLCVLLLQCAMYAGYRTIFGKPNQPVPA